MKTKTSWRVCFASVKRTKIPVDVTILVPWIVKALQDGPISRKELLKRVEVIGNEHGIIVAISFLTKAITIWHQNKAIIRIRYGWWALSDFTLSPAPVSGLKLGQPSRMSKPMQAKASRAKIFIRHGRSEAWRRLADYLENRLGMEVVEFNREPMAGKTIKERLEGMLTIVSFAVLVMTGEDETATGNIRTRSNVIHETGLFQRKLGFSKAIILREEGCEDFSNIDSLIWLGFAKGRIEQTFVDLERALLREDIIKRRY